MAFLGLKSITENGHPVDNLELTRFVLKEDYLQEINDIKFSSEKYTDDAIKSKLDEMDKKLTHREWSIGLLVSIVIGLVIFIFS